MPFLRLILKNVRRNLLRTILMSLGTIALVCVVTLIWSILSFLDQVTAEKSNNFKAIVTERWQIPSRLPFAYASALADGAARRPGDVRPMDSMSWAFYGGSTEQGTITRESMMFAFALEPKKLATMMDDLDSLPPDQAAELQRNIHKLEQNKRGMIIGLERLKALNKRVGERIKIYSMNYKDIDLEFDIVGTFPDGRYNQTAAMNRDYLNDALDEYPRSHGGQAHPMADAALNLMWLRVADSDSFQRIAGQIMASPNFTSPAVKCETASSGIASFLDAYKDLIWGFRWLLSPAILVTLSLILANAISINVRERRMEMAVFKVLGFRPGHILALVIGEAVAIGALSGLVSAGGTYWLIDHVIGGLKFPIAFFPAFFIPAAAIWWGLAIGGLTSLAGSLMPAWTACRIKVSEVFSRVA
ncbi:MAG TPA: ABC transporter permease [Pirellulales bacterium]|nr:ABC transporter permease [Pirellulales bacterium]